MKVPSFDVSTGTYGSNGMANTFTYDPTTGTYAAAVTCCGETNSEKLERLQSEQKRIADEIGEVRKELEKPKAKTRGETLAANIIRQDSFDESLLRCYHKTGTAYLLATSGRDHAQSFATFVQSSIAAHIDAEIAAAKAEQKEADAKIASDLFLDTQYASPAYGSLTVSVSYRSSVAEAIRKS